MIRQLFEAQRPLKRGISLIYDCCSIAIAFYAATCIRLGTFSPPIGTHELTALALTGALSILVFIRMGMYRAILRYISTTAVVSIVISVCISGMLLTIMSFFTHSLIPRSVPLLYTLLALIFIGTPRLLVRSIVMLINNQTIEQQEPILIYGAGHTGHQLALALQASPHKVMGFIDDNPKLSSTSIAGIKVYSTHALSELIASHKITKILLALGNTSHARRAAIIKELEKHTISVQTVPAISDILSGKTRIEQIRDVDIEDLLGRDAVQANPALLGACINRKVVMVTGAGGSIGSEICRQIVKQNPKTLILFELNEFSLYSIEMELKKELCAQGKSDIQLVALLGSVQREDRMETIMSSFGVQTIYHAAAYKHVPLVEHNIVEGVINNVFGTWYCAEAAIKANVESFVLISTDKAVRPTNIMGASKRMAELVLQALSKRQQKTRFTMVRFGNVLGSSGSVVPLFREQIKRHGPITVTHPDIIRYFMTIPEAAELVIQAGSMGTGGDVFVLDMGEPVKIVDLAKRMIHLSGFEVRDDKHPEGDIEINYTGLRPGEKLYEELLIGDNVSGTEHSRIMRAEEEHLGWPETALLLAKIDDACHTYKCDAVKKLLLEAPTGFNSQEQIRDDVWLKKQEHGKLRLV
jgi:FlaA1/EpsC-like NDP-sugar epimerase